MNRRRLLETGLGGGALLALGTLGYGLGSREPARGLDEGTGFVALDAMQRAIVAAIGASLLAGALPTSQAERREALGRTVRGVDAIVAGLPAGLQDEFGQLFKVLGFPPTRVLVAGIWTPWSSAPPAAIDAFLERWRRSPVGLLRSGYQALHQVVFAAWYAQRSAWRSIGYPGPPVVR